MFRQLTTRAAIALLTFAAAADAFAQSSTDLFDVTQTTIAISSHTTTIFGANDNTLANDTAYNIFGGSANNSPEPSDRMLFLDGTGTAFVNFTRSGTATINTITLYNEADGGVNEGNRATTNFALEADTNLDGFYDRVLLWNRNPADNGTANTYVIPENNYTSFRAEFTPPNNPGSRILEMDAINNPLAVANLRYLDRTLLNASTNNLGAGDEPAGFVNSITPAVGIGGDTPQDVFGNNDGTVEGNTFIFAAGGVQNLDFTTSAPVTLGGIAVNTGADNGEDGFRGTSLFRFFADVNNNGFGDDLPLITVNPTDNNQFDYLFFGQLVTATSFRAEFTSSGGESRIIEIDALIPEPATWSLLAIGGVFAMRRRKR